MELVIKTFEDLTIEELYNILKLRNEVFVVEQNCVYQDCDNNDKFSYHLFFKDNNDIISYLRIFKKNQVDEALIGRVVVKPEYRGRGFARKIVKKAIEFIIEDLSTNNIKMSAQSYLVDFYRSFGFIVISEEYLEDDIPHIEMFYENK